jgi:hypothetical protein
MANKIDVAGTGVTGGAQVLLVLDPHSQMVATSLGAVLGLGFSVWSYFSDKRNKELFDKDTLVEQVLIKVKQSDDFASFVFDLWQKHNLESSEDRRKMLKKFLEQEANRDNNQFENFSKIGYIMQNANLKALKVLSIIHSEIVQKRKIDHEASDGRLLNLQRLTPLVQSVETMHEQDVEYFMNELGSYGLISFLHGRYNGPFYLETKLGFIFMEYIRQ